MLLKPGRLLFKQSASVAWIPRADGIPADLAINGSDGQAWINKGVQSLHSVLTVTRASTRYVRSTSGLWSSVSNNVLGLHTPVGGTQGIIAEEERTNQVRNNSMQGTVAGTPGTIPTNWGAGFGAGFTSTVVGTGTEDGIDYIDIRVAGTASGSSIPIAVRFEANNLIAATTGQTWTTSVFLKEVAGSLPGTLQHQLRETDAGGTVLATSLIGSTFTPTGSALNLQRYSASAALGQATTAFVTSLFTMAAVANGTVVDFTLRIGWPQLELGAFATTPIRTTGSAATRAAETPYLTLPEGQLGLSAYTLFTKHRWPDVVDASKFPSIAALRQSGADNSQNSIESFDFSGPNSVGNIVRAANVSQLDRTQTATANTTVKAAVSTQANAHLVSVNGVALTPTSTGSPPTGIDRLNIGHNGPADVLNSTIELIAIWGSARSTGALDALTA